MSLLFEPLKLRALTLKNRIMMSPMCQYQAHDGFATDWHLVHYGARAAGGTGLIMVEATAVEPRGRISPWDLGIWDDAHIEPLARLVRFVKSQGSAIGIQLAHAGRKASSKEGKPFLASDGGWTPLAPTAAPYGEGFPVPEEMTTEVLHLTVSLFRSAVKRAQAAGFDVVETHSAHGYLNHEFLSPLSNRRSDAYGGSFENRTRFVLEVVRTMRNSWPDDKPLFTRVSATDWMEPEGWTADDTVRLAIELRKAGVDLVDCSSGGLVPHARVLAGPGYQVPFAGRVKREAGIATGAVGFLTTGAQAEEVLEKGHADLAIVGREFLRDPNFPLRAARELGVDVPWPTPYHLVKPALGDRR